MRPKKRPGRWRPSRLPPEACGLQAVGVSRKKALEYAERLMKHPRAALELVLRHNKSGVTLLHGRRAVTRCYSKPMGKAQASEMARALGVELPPLGGSVQATVPNGTFYRAIAISSLNLRIPGVFKLLDRLQDEAEMAIGP